MWLCRLLILLAFGFTFSVSLNPAKKQLGLFSFIKFRNDPCIGQSGTSQRNGTCYTQDECSARNGDGIGECAEGYGVCCLIKLDCGGQSNDNTTYLVQENTNKPSNDECIYKICPSSKAICRIRYDFTRFQIAGPYSADMATSNRAVVGDCVTDGFAVSSSSGVGSPLICGINTGQHLYVDVVNNMCSQATFFFKASTSTTRYYDIQVTQFECQDDMGGPPGCLQYLTSTSGTIASFNYPIGSTSLTSTGSGQPTHLANQLYDICIRRASGYCSVCYVPEFTGTTGTTGAAFGLSVSNIATMATHDTDCSTDYVIIPMAVSTSAIANLMSGISLGKERICGRVFSTITQTAAIAYGTSANALSVCSGVRPFKVGVHFDQNEAYSGSDDTTQEHGVTNVPNGIIGFSLNYVQNKCS